jgi:hypothetical protein
MDPEALILLQRVVELLERYLDHLTSGSPLDKFMTVAVPAVSGLLGATIGGFFAMMAARASARGQLELAEANSEREWRRGLVQGLLNYAHSALASEAHLLHAWVERDTDALRAALRDFRRRNILVEGQWIATDNDGVVKSARYLLDCERQFKTLFERAVDGLLATDPPDWQRFNQSLSELESHHQDLGNAVRGVTLTVAEYVHPRKQAPRRPWWKFWER